MTEGDKNLAIFGGLGFFFVLLLSGRFRHDDARRAARGVIMKRG